MSAACCGLGDEADALTAPAEPHQKPLRLSLAPDDAPALTVAAPASPVGDTMPFDVDENAKEPVDDGGDDGDENAPSLSRSARAMGRVFDKPSHPHVDGCFLALWVGLIAIFAGLTIVDFLGRESMESVQLVRMSRRDVPVVPVVIEVRCSTAWGCSDGWGQPRPTQFATIRRTYAEPHACASDDYEMTLSESFAPGRLASTLCYSPDYADGLDISIPFDELAVYGDTAAPRLEVTLTSPRSDMYLRLDVEPQQRKTVFVGQFLKEKPKRGATASFLRQAGLAAGDESIKASSQEPFVQDLFYDGGAAASRRRRGVVATPTRRR